VNSVSFGELQQLVTAHGYWAVALIVGLESMGLPLPGETVLVLAAIYAATEPSFNVWVVIAVTAFGAIVGDNADYWLGLRYGYALLLRYGERIGMFEARIKLGQYLYLKHGAKVMRPWLSPAPVQLRKQRENGSKKTIRPFRSRCMTAWRVSTRSSSRRSA
jgi:membrane protein YqaA with SNARE-associated domain